MDPHGYMINTLVHTMVIAAAGSVITQRPYTSVSKCCLFLSINAGSGMNKKAAYPKFDSAFIWRTTAQTITGHMVELFQHLSGETALTHFFRKYKTKDTQTSSTPNESPENSVQTQRTASERLVKYVY